MNDQEQLIEFVRYPAAGWVGDATSLALMALARAIVIAACIIANRDIPWRGLK